MRHDLIADDLILCIKMKRYKMLVSIVFEWLDQRREIIRTKDSMRFGVCLFDKSKTNFWHQIFEMAFEFATVHGIFPSELRAAQRSTCGTARNIRPRDPWSMPPHSGARRAWH
jgi:hypothetical protein